jgi:tetratricopeptide (TPR) repeat protein
MLGRTTALLVVTSCACTPRSGTTPTTRAVDAGDQAAPAEAADALLEATAAQAGNASGRRPDGATGDPGAPPIVGPAGARAFLARGRALAAKSEWDKASKELQRGAELDPSNAALLGEYTWTLIQIRAVDRAKDVAARALALPSQGDLRASLLYNAGRVAQALGDEAEAARHYDASVALRKNAEVSAQRASLYVHTLHGVRDFSDYGAIGERCVEGSREGIAQCQRRAGAQLPLAGPVTFALKEPRSGLVVTTLSVPGDHDCVADDVRLYLAKGPKLVYVASLESGSCGEHGSYQVGASDVRVDELAVGSLSTVWVHWHATRDSYCGPCEVIRSHEVIEALAVCVPDVTRRGRICPFSLSLDTASETVEAENFQGPPTKSAVRYAVEPAGDRLRVSLREGTASPEVVERLGDYALR